MNLNTTGNKFHLVSETYVVLGSLSYLGLAVLIISNNILLMCAVHFNKTLQRPTFYFLLSLSVSDIAIGLLILPLRYLEISAPIWTDDVAFCATLLSLSLLTLTGAILNLVAMTLNRLYAVIAPFHYHVYMTPKLATSIIILTWGVALACTLYLLLGHNHGLAKVNPNGMCLFTDHLTNEFLSFYVPVIVIAPMVMLSVAYCKIFAISQKQRRRIATTITSVDRNNRLRKTPILKDLKGSRTIFLCVTSFYICWIPATTAIVIRAVCKNCLSHTSMLLLYILFYSHSALNPVLFGWLNRDFRETYKAILPFLKQASVNINLLESRFSRADEDAREILDSFQMSVIGNRISPSNREITP